MNDRINDEGSLKQPGVDAKRKPPYNGASPGQSPISLPDDLHDLFSIGAAGDEEDPLAALRNDPNYAALIRDLEYIAKQARLLFEPAQEAPSDEVWNKIKNHLPKPSDA